MILSSQKNYKMWIKMSFNKQKKIMEIFSTGRKGTKKGKEKDMIGCKIFKLYNKLLNKN